VTSISSLALPLVNSPLMYMSFMVYLCNSVTLNAMRGLRLVSAYG
jgi:hypothetical protein